MTKHRLRPRAFRLDDQRVALDDAPGPVAPTAVDRSETTPIPASTRAEGLDETDDGSRRRKIPGGEAAEARPWARDGGGSGGLVWLTLGLWASDLIEDCSRGPLRSAGSAAFALLFVIGLRASRDAKSPR